MRTLLALTLLAALATPVSAQIQPECNSLSGCAAALPPTAQARQVACNSPQWQQLETIGTNVKDAQAAACAGDFPRARNLLSEALKVLFAALPHNQIPAVVEVANALFQNLASVFKSA